MRLHRSLANAQKLTLIGEIGGVESLIDGKELLQGSSAVERQVLLARQQSVFLSLDIAPVTVGKSAILALAHRVEGVAGMAHDLELVE